MHIGWNWQNKITEKADDNVCFSFNWFLGTDITEDIFCFVHKAEPHLNVCELCFCTQQALSVLPSSEGQLDRVWTTAAEPSSQLLRTFNVLEPSQSKRNCGQLSPAAGQTSVNFPKCHTTTYETKQCWKYVSWGCLLYFLFFFFFYMFSNEIWIFDQAFQEYGVSHTDFFIPTWAKLCYWSTYFDLTKLIWGIFSIKLCRLKVVMCYFKIFELLIGFRTLFSARWCAWHNTETWVRQWK